MATTTSITSTYAGEFAGKYVSAALLSGNTIANNLIEVKPIHTPTSVIIFGKITLEFLFDTNLIFFFGFSIYLFAINVSPATAL